MITNDITITVQDQTGEVHQLIVPLDIQLTLKDVCKAYDLPMEAMCGGMAMCATCHCTILNKVSLLPDKSDIEEALLSEIFADSLNSRLACQIPMTKELDGLSVELL